MLNKTILVLGIGPPQNDVILYCKNNGMKVIACAHKAEGPGKKNSDVFVQVDIKNIEEVKQLAINYNVDFIYSAGSELAVFTSNKVSEEIGLPHFFESATAKTLSDKGAWRYKLGVDAPGQVKYQTARNFEEISKNFVYPFVIKPSDGSGQRGVHLINNKKELKEFFPKAKNFSRKGTVIAEDFIDGPEISVNGYLLNGKNVFSLISDRISYKEYPGGIIDKHILPSTYQTGNLQKQVDEIIRHIVKVFNINDGPIYLQMKLSNGILKLIEFTPRLDGCHMWRLINFYTGVNLLDTTIKNLLSKHINKDVFKYSPSNDSLILDFISQKPNTIVEFTDTSSNDYTLYFEKYLAEGELVPKVTGYIEKVGYRIYVDNRNTLS